MSKRQKSKKAKRETLQREVEAQLVAIGKPQPEPPPNPRNYKDADWSEVG